MRNHHNILIVNGYEGVIGFCGGLDIYPDRVPTRASQEMHRNYRREPLVEKREQRME
jgi:hypothetical protein